MASRRASGSGPKPPSRTRAGDGAESGAAELALRERFAALSEYDGALRARGYSVIAGVDEAGRGALAGPVVSAAVVLRERCDLPGVDDSKALAEADREALFREIVSASVSVGISFGHPSLIDRENILRSTLMTMHRAVAALRMQPDLVLVDGRETFQWPGRLVPVIGGDAKSLSIAAASILAKVARDRLMRRMHRVYPCYHFDENKGYGTRDHWAAIVEHGVAVIHRQTFLGKVVANNLSMF